MSEKRKNILHNVRQGTLVTLVLLLLCGFLFPAALSGLSAKRRSGVHGGLLLMGPSFRISLQHLL